MNEAELGLKAVSSLRDRKRYGEVTRAREKIWSELLTDPFERTAAFGDIHKVGCAAGCLSPLTLLRTPRHAICASEMQRSNRSGL